MMNMRYCLYTGDNHSMLRQLNASPISTEVYDNQSVQVRKNWGDRSIVLATTIDSVVCTCRLYRLLLSMASGYT